MEADNDPAPVQVVLTEDARDSLAEIKNGVIVARLWKLIGKLAGWPKVSGAKPLKGELAGRYRLRIGDYRLQFRVQTTRTEKVVEDRDEKGKLTRKTLSETTYKVIVEKVGHRDRFYDA